MNKKQQTLLIIGTIILMIITGIGGFILGQKFYDKEEEIKEELNDNKEENNINKTTKERVDDIIANELEQLIPLKSLNELSNQDKLQTILYMYVKNGSGYTDTIQKSTLENIFKNSSIRNLGIEYKDIYEERQLQDTENTIYIIENGVYKKTIGGGTGGYIGLIQKKLVDYKEENNKVTISYKYAFYKNEGDGPTPINIYYTFEDAKNNQNKIKTFDPLDYKDELYPNEPFSYPKAKEAAENYDFSKDLDKLNTYTYVFELINNELILIDFNRK